MAARKRGARRSAKTGRTDREDDGRRWSQRVTETSNALDLEPSVFTLRDPTEIARSLKRSADGSRRRKSDPYRSAMSMLTFYINRAGSGLSKSRRRVLERAKDRLRALYGRAPKHDEARPRGRGARR
ncbi:MAG TPA: DUF3175 domain-containing protein [Myxococcota bacterium]|jgi:hypothetical protein|nr:DUF3175 domain-containing protein [Myxococcota bacterium]